MVPLANPPEHPQAPIPKLLEMTEHPGTMAADREPSHPLARQLFPVRIPDLAFPAGSGISGAVSAPAPAVAALQPEGHAALSACHFKELRASRNQEQMAGIGQLQNLP